MSGPAPPTLVLASTSSHRRELLTRLRIPFRSEAPLVDETRRAGETPEHTAARLAREKASTVAARTPGAVVIGSDQVAIRGDEVLGKPGDRERCLRQLAGSAGRTVDFLTAVCVIDGRTGRRDEHIDRTQVVFRALDSAEIERYVDADRPWDCAGGFKAESLGIALFERIESSDPTALTGLPLTWVSAVLRRCGYSVP